MKRILLAVLLLSSLTLAPVVALGTASDIVPAVTPTQAAINVSKVCISALTFDVKGHVAIVIYQRCSSPGNYLGTENVTLTITDTGYTLVQPFASPVTGTNVNWTTVTTDLSGVAGAVKTLTTRVFAGT